MSILTDWTTSVVSTLTTGLTGYTIETGERDGTSRDRDVACVFADPAGPENPDSNVQFTRPVLKVRAWPRNPKQVKVTSPRDPAPLNDLLEQIEQLLQPGQVLPGIGIGGLYFFVTGTAIDRIDWGVELTLTGWAENPAVLA